MTFLRNVFVAACCVILSSPAWSAACTNTIGKKECNGSYFVCNTDADCKDVKKLPSNATAGHCWARSGKGYSVCTATKCNDNYDVKGGRCVKKNKNATSTPPAQVQEIIERDYSATCKLKFSSGKEIEKVNQAGDDNSSLKMVWYTSVGGDDLVSSDTNSNVYDPATPSLRDLVAIDGKNITDQEKQYLQKQGVYDIDFDCTGNGTYVLVAKYNAWPDVRDEIIPEGGNILVKDGTECSLTFAKGQTLSGVHYANSRVLHGELFVSKTGKNMSIDYDHDNVGQMSSNYYGPGDDNNCIINNDASWVLGNHCYDAGNVPNMQDLVAVNGKNLDATNIEKLKKADEISFYCDPESKEGYVFYLQTVQETSGDDENGVLNSGDETDTPAEDKPADAASGDNNNPADNSQDDGTDDDTETVTSPDNAEAIADAEKAYDAAHEKETSLANRLLGGASMAATGIGGMQLAQGLAERSADAAAEQDMQAYLSTFTCKIGDAGGKLYKGGEMGIEVSGGNKLASLYQQYVDLAADLKERKAALGMAPGIESAVVMDKANMGLYDDTGRGIENGTYASLYRASKGNENDAKKLAEQKDTSANRVKGGAIAAGVGAVGGAIGNAVVNSENQDDPNSDIVCYSDLQKLHPVDCKSPYRRVCQIPGSAINVYTEVDCGTMTVKGGQQIH